MIKLTSRATLLKRINRLTRKRKKLLQLKQNPTRSAEIDELGSQILVLRKDITNPNKCAEPKEKIHFRNNSNVIAFINGKRVTAVATYIDDINDVAEITLADGSTHIVDDIQRNLRPQKFKYFNTFQPIRNRKA